MSTDKDNREYDRDKELQNKDRDQEVQPGDDNAEKLEPQHPERLRDDAHRMNKRTNDVQGSVSYNETTRKINEDSDDNMEAQWKGIESDYRKRYPNVTDEDVDYKSGEFDSMTGRIAKRTDRNREDVNNEIRDWQSSTQNN